MPFTIIKGTFHVIGYSPDGDSIRFKAGDEANWNKLDGPFVRLNARKHAQLRFEGIDTLETHYQNHHQPLEFAGKATDFLLAQLGIEDVIWNSANTRVISAQDGTAGYILTRTTERNRRPVAFVFAGPSDKADGEPLFLDRTLLKQSINYKLLESGLAFPTYYKGLFSDLRSEMTDTVMAARSSDQGFWPQDRTTNGVAVNDIEAVTERYIILPKLFRRIIDYIGNGGDIAGFKEHLALNPEPILIISEAHFTNFDTIVNVEGQVVKLEKVPEDVIFLT